MPHPATQPSLQPALQPVDCKLLVNSLDHGDTTIVSDTYKKGVALHHRPKYFIHMACVLWYLIGLMNTL